MQSISSSITPFTKFILPGGFIAAWPAWLYQIQDPKFGYMPAVVWSAACVFLVWWTLPIKKVSVSADQFLISNYLREIRVPVTQLVKIGEDRGNRTPNIALFFDPPTAFGRKIRIVPPFSRKEFDRIAQLLRGIIGKNEPPNKSVQTTAMTPPPSTTRGAPLSDL